MDSLLPQLEDLTSTVDELETALQPIISSALSASTSKLPLLDKAKLYVLATYAIESILFSYLRLNGVDAKAHPVFQELNRVKEYFSKIKAAEDIGADGRSKTAPKLDQGAAGRFIKAGLAGNDKYDRERAATKEKEKAGAKRKLEEISVGTHTRFDGAAKRAKASEEEHVNVVKANALDDADEDDEAQDEGTLEPGSWSEDITSRTPNSAQHDPSGSDARNESSSRKTNEQAGMALLNEHDSAQLLALKAKSPYEMTEEERKLKKQLKKKSKKLFKNTKVQRLEDERADEMK